MRIQLTSFVRGGGRKSPLDSPITFYRVINRRLFPTCSVICRETGGLFVMAPGKNYDIKGAAGLSRRLLTRGAAGGRRGSTAQPENFNLNGVIFPEPRVLLPPSHFSTATQSIRTEGSPKADISYRKIGRDKQTPGPKRHSTELIIYSGELDGTCACVCVFIIFCLECAIVGSYQLFIALRFHYWEVVLEVELKKTK